MTGKEFDQAIKEKAEQAQYPYRDAAWDSFSRKAGHASGSRLTGPHKALAVAAGVVITAGVVTGILIHANKTRTQPQMPVEIAATDSSIVTTDTLVLQKPLREKAGLPEEKVRSTSAAAAKKAAIEEHDIDTKPVSGDTLTKVQPSKADGKPVRKRTRVIYGRPLEINVDTITEMEPTDEQLRNGNSRLF